MKKNILVTTLMMIFMISAYAITTCDTNTTSTQPSPTAMAGRLADGPSTPKPNFDEATYNWSRTFAEVLQLTNQKHYKPDNVEDSMMKSIDAFLNNLDPHSAFLAPKTYQRMMESTSGEFFGIGIIIDNTRKPEDKSSDCY